MSINLTDEIEVKTKKGKLGAAKQIFLEGDTTSLQKEHEDNQAHFDTLDNRSSQMEESIKNISVTGGASVASAVTYDNTASGLEAVNVKGAIDEVSSTSHFAKRGGIVNISTNYNSTNIAEVLTLEQAIAKVPSKDRVLGFQGKFLTDTGWKTYQFTGDSITNWNNIDRWEFIITSSDLKQTTGQSTTTPMSQKSTSEAIQNNTIAINKETDTKLDKLREKIYDNMSRSKWVQMLEDNGFFLTDENMNVMFCVIGGIIDGLGFGDNLKEKIINIIKENVDFSDIEKSISNINYAMLNLSNEVSNIPLMNVDEDGINITDANGNIAWFIRPVVVEQEGMYMIDENMNIGISLIDGKFKFSNIDIDTPTVDNDIDYSLIARTNRALRELNTVKDQIDSSIPYLLEVKSGETVSKTTTIPNDKTKKKAIVRLRLHHGASKYTPNENDIFFDGACKTDFSDVRFFDNEGNILKASFNKCFNFGIYRDTNLNNFGDALKATSQGYLIGANDDRGIVISKDNGATTTLIDNTTSVTSNKSDLYGYRSIFPIYIDKYDNIFGYAGGKLYKLLAQDDYATIREVLDFSFVNTQGDGRTVYPDIQVHGMDADINGNLFVGMYQKTDIYHIQIWVSKDEGETWTRKYYSYDNAAKTKQHVHHIHADKYTSKVYVGIDGGYPAQGPTVIVTEDGGESWTDITTQLKAQRGHDYYPTYFGQDYMLGGGENYTLGGNSIVIGDLRNNIDISYKGYGGCRMFADFGDDNLIVTGVQRCKTYSENQIVISKNKGKSWETVMRFDTPSRNTSGDGFRTVINCGILNGDTDECVILSKGNYISSFRIYNGIDFYREVEIEIENADASPIEIIAKTGYVMPYPYSTVRGIENDAILYEVKLNEGCGKLISDSLGNISKVEGDIEWEKTEEPVRYGEYVSNNETKPFDFSSAAKIKGIVNFGKIPQLDFSYGYTITMWINEKNRKCNYEDEDALSTNYIVDNVPYILASFGNADLIRYNSSIGLMPRDATTASKRKTKENGSYVMNCSDNYYFIAIVVSSDKVMGYLNGTAFTGSDGGRWIDYTGTKLNEADFTIGSKNSEPIGYISDIKVYGKELSDNEVLDLYKGFNY